MTIPSGFQPTPDDYVRQEMLIERLQSQLRRAALTAFVAFLLGFCLALLMAWVA